MQTTNLSALGLLLLTGCVEVEAGTSRRAAIYGTDDRSEVAGHPLEQRALRSTVALIPATEGGEALSAGRWPDLPTLGERLGLCPDEAFAEQPALAACSGVLVAEDVVLTARHCVPTPERCAELFVVFDFALDAGGTLAPLREVHRCAALLAAGESEEPDQDYALIALERPASAEREPVPLRNDEPPAAPGERITVIGHPSGLPLKIDDRAHVRAGPPARVSYLVAADTFAGSSGSAVLDEAGRLLGVIAGGAPDYVQEGDCVRALVHAEHEGRERVIPAERALAALALPPAGCRCAGGRTPPLALLLLFAVTRVTTRGARTR